MYLIITLADEDMEVVQSLRFDSGEAAEAALLRLRNGTDQVATVESDTGDSITMHRSAIADLQLSSVAPPQRERATLVGLDDLINRLGQPIYDGQNTFGFIVGRPPYTVNVTNQPDRVLVWNCGGERPNRCMAELRGANEYRYWPCALHQADPLPS